MRAALVLVAVLAAFAPADPAAAHTRSESFSSWQAGAADVVGRLRISEREALRGARDPVGARGVLEALARDVVVGAGGIACVRTALHVGVVDARGDLTATLRFRCPSPHERVVRMAGPFTSNAHIHFATVSTPSGDVREYIVTDARHAIRLDAGPVTTTPGRVARYALTGFTHVLSGADHVAFLLALCLAARRVRTLVWAASGFTLGHSASLALATLGWIAPDRLLLEALIGFTIALAAVDALLARLGALDVRTRALAALAAAAPALLPLTRGGDGIAVFVGCALLAFASLQRGSATGADDAFRVALTALFGLVHGVGFAGALSAPGEAARHLPSMLLGFNVGVELGQLLVIVATLAVAAAGRRWLAPTRRWVAPVAAASVLAVVGAYWFTARLAEWPA